MSRAMSNRSLRGQAFWGSSAVITAGQRLTTLPAGDSDGCLRNHSRIPPTPPRSRPVSLRSISRWSGWIASASSLHRPELSAAARQAIERLVPEADGIILSDYAKGFLSQSIIDCVRGAAAAHGKIITVDPSPLNPVDWSGVTAIKPNRAEALRAAGLHELSGDVIMQEVGERLLDKWKARLILLTLGEEGMLLFEAGQPVFRTPSRAREVFDVSGAGDTAIAMFTVALCAGAAPAEAAELANAASGIVVGKLGTATVTARRADCPFRGASMSSTAAGSPETPVLRSACASTVRMDPASFPAPHSA